MLTRNRLLVVVLLIAAVGCKSDSKKASPSDSGTDAMAKAGDAASKSDSGGGGSKDAGTTGSTDASAAKDAANGGDDAGHPGSSMPLRAGKYDIVYSGDLPGIDQRRDVLASFGTSGGLTGYMASADEHPTLGSAKDAEQGGDDAVRVGRWHDGTLGGKFYNTPLAVTSGGFHYAIGARSAALPSSGSTSYDILAATAPTVGAGAFAPGTITGGAQVLWGSPARVAVDVTITIPSDGTYHVVTAGGLINPAQSELVFATAAPFFYGVDFIGHRSLSATSSGYGCNNDGTDGGTAGPCYANLQGFALGDNADHLSLAYVLTAGGQDGVHGVLALKKH